MTNPDDLNLVSHDDGCPICGERRVDYLVWLDDEWVRCTSCRIQYDPVTKHTRNDDRHAR